MRVCVCMCVGDAVGKSEVVFQLVLLSALYLVVHTQNMEYYILANGNILNIGKDI